MAELPELLRNERLSPQQGMLGMGAGRGPDDGGSAVALGPDDAGEVLTLQRAAYVSEAQAHNDLWLPPLTQTLAELRAELARPTVWAWGYRDSLRLVAAVRVEVHDATALIGRLVVVPDRQNQGLGSRLLLEAEGRLPDTVTTLASCSPASTATPTCASTDAWATTTPTAVRPAPTS